MNRLSKRLEVLASFIDENDSLVDVGCDHGYLGIYLKENNLCKNVICSDVNQNALNSAINNIKNSKVSIDCYLSDGIKDVPLENINTLLIAGMGTSTIIGILKDKNKLNNINKIVLQSNNNHEELRRFMNNIGYYLVKEEYIFDKGKWYIIMLYDKDNKNNTEIELKYGYLNNDYANYLLDNYKKILNRIPNNNEDYNKYKEIIKDIETMIK